MRASTCRRSSSAARGRSASSPRCACDSPPRATTALVALADTAAAVDLLPRLRERAPSLQAVELFYPEGLALVRAHRRLPDPFGGALTHEPGAYVLVECAGRDDPLPELAEALRGAVDDTHVVVATDTAARRALWAYREAHNETLNARGVPHKLDVCVPIGALATFEAEVRALVEDVAPGSLTVLWAHLGDGNVHVNVLGPAPEDERVDEAVLRLAVAHGGSISAEHGIGVAKARFLPLGRGEDERRAMAAVKRALDPQGLLNPGVLLPPTDPRGEGNHP